jgi:hypothetical protein
MKNFLKVMTTAAALTGAAMFASAPARADGVSISIGVPGIGFSYSSGGYCDEWGCPDGYWDYPIYYGPVYYGGEWYRGPVYYRLRHGHYYYWIHGGWHRDQWRGRYPRWYRRHEYRYGPSLGYDYYRGHGFRHDHDRHWRGDRRWDRHEIREDRRDFRRDRRDVRHDRRDDRRDRRDDRRDHRDDRHDHDHH